MRTPGQALVPHLRSTRKACGSHMSHGNKIIHEGTARITTVDGTFDVMCSVRRVVSNLEGSAGATVADISSWGGVFDAPIGTGLKKCKATIDLTVDLARSSSEMTSATTRGGVCWHRSRSVLNPSACQRVPVTPGMERFLLGATGPATRRAGVSGRWC
jgi:hypothetical protein